MKYKHAKKAKSEIENILFNSQTKKYINIGILIFMGSLMLWMF
jgi:hypothetical protein